MSTVTIPLSLAQFVRKVWLPANPNKLRNAHPDAVANAKAFIAAVQSAEALPSESRLTKGDANDGRDASPEVHAVTGAAHPPHAALDMALSYLGDGEPFGAPVTDAMIERALEAAQGAIVDTRRFWTGDDRAAVKAMLVAALGSTPSKSAETVETPKQLDYLKAHILDEVALERDALAAQVATLLAENKELRSASEAPRWVPVADRLPASGERVLITGWAYNKPGSARWFKVAYQGETHDYGTWWSDETDEQLFTPTHWCPLGAPTDSRGHGE